MMTRKEAEQRALELYPKQIKLMDNYTSNVQREAYLQCWEDMQVAEDAKQAADEVDKDKLMEPIIKSVTNCPTCGSECDVKGERETH